MLETYPALEPVSFLLACFKMENAHAWHVYIYGKMDPAKARIEMSRCDSLQLTA
jgi:hypothetical protein